jgi:L-fuculose-phosphate aldolase
MQDGILPGTLKTEEAHRQAICAAGRRTYERGYVASTDGNISVRLDQGRILTTPTCLNKGMMTPEDLVITDPEGRRLSGRRSASSELAMHLLIYKLRPDINAVCHAHPPAATGYAAAGIPLDKAILCELIIGLGRVPVAPYGTPGTRELPDSIEPYVRDHEAILLANHGVVTYGPDLLTAFFRMETTEHFARVALVSKLLGKQVELSGVEIEKLLVAKARYTAQAAASVAPPTRVAPNSPASNYAPEAGDSPDSQRITLTRQELEALIDEAVQKDRARAS